MGKKNFSKKKNEFIFAFNYTFRIKMVIGTLSRMQTSLVYYDGLQTDFWAFSREFGGF
jgi:hypothetical protein